ncbi:DgyrCDS4794 [Dimorphilus gyrociliatus]|uniref:Translocation protein SEC62 n=1 Tax=Dimorphilus gyrociliatus TaxID=2664684 RepID=A0A7I8VKN7_9ANNE|nr:DgyrCDS4794 [Dimorphilus gyrociliatus]
MDLPGRNFAGFTGKDIVDKLLDSKWASRKPILFTTRQSCVNFCQMLAILVKLLDKGFFHRIEKQKNSKKKEETPGEIKKKKKEYRENDKKDGKKNKSKKNKRKIFILEHEEQIFKDGDNYYVWVYDPVSLKTWIIGSFIVLGVIGICLFPLWPPKVRDSIYYLSILGTGFIGLLFFLYILRAIIFVIVWTSTRGKYHLWILPNLTEDCGFVESFIPMYSSSVIESKIVKQDNLEIESKVEHTERQDDFVSEKENNE